MVTVTPTTITPFVLSPSVVDGGTTGVTTLSAPAPPSGATITLHSSDASVTPNGGNSLVIPAGSLTGTFAISTSTGTAEKTVTITAAYNGAVTAILDVKPTVPTTSAPNTMTIAPDNVCGGYQTTGTVYFAAAVPHNNDPVYLSSNTNVATVPQYIYAQGGETQDSFTVNTSAVSVPTKVTISAMTATGVVIVSKQLTVHP